MIDLARQCLERAGVRTKGMLAQELVGARSRSAMRRHGTTGDFPVLLENVLYKVLLAQYAITPDTWTKFCAIGTVTDFKASKRYRMGTFGSLSALNEPASSRTSRSPTASASRSRPARRATSSGSAARRSSTMTWGRSRPSRRSSAARRSCRSRSTSTRCSRSTAASARDVGRPDAVPRDAQQHRRPAPRSARRDRRGPRRDGVAEGSVEQRDPRADAGGARAADRPRRHGAPDQQRPVRLRLTKFQIPNRVGNLFRDIVDSPRITGTRRYLFADPGIAPTIEVAFLDGQAQPFMEMREGWRVDGVEWKVREDYGIVGAIDFRGAVTNAGV
jgi:hypothetical protein